jgi:NAD(P)H-hydrate epimerase
VSVETLMENAGRGVAEVLRSRFPFARKFAFYCGSGNNGGDGFAAALHLKAAGLDPRVFLATGEVKSKTATKHLELARKAGVPVDPWRPGAGLDADVLVDCLLGTGLEGPPREEIARVIRETNVAGKPLVAVDVPSGSGARGGVRASLTVALHAPKSGIPPEASGEVETVGIGIPPEAVARTGPGEMRLFPVPRKDAHKGQTGRLMVVAGGPYHGAPALAALAAYRVGADLVHVVAPRRCADRLAGYGASLILHDLPGDALAPEDAAAVQDRGRGMHALLIGPGLGRDERTVEAAAAIIRAATCPMVLDADALSVVAAKPEVVQGKTCLLTPHKGELRVLLNGLGLHREADQLGAAEVARTLGATVLLKGPVDFVTDGARTKENHFGNPGMTVGGTGDVLAGVCAGLLSRSLSTFDAGRLGIYIVTRAGDRVFQRLSYGLMPHDIVEEIPRLLVDELVHDGQT